jgi:hypothetical protein
MALCVMPACSLPDDAAVGPERTGGLSTVTSAITRDPRVWYNPYGGIDWSATRQYKAQTHDHTGLSTARLMSYDSAGYAFPPIMEYSGVASLSYAVTRRLWPSDSVLPEGVRRTSAALRTWVPSGEEVGFAHITSLFLTRYIAKWEPSQYATRAPWMYENTQEAIDLVRQLGGFPILAHPWGPWAQFSGLRRYAGIEIYSAYAEHFFGDGSKPYFAEVNRNREILQAWDRVLMRGEFVVGVAVNDHFGPYRPLSAVSRRVRDSGKILVIARDTALSSYEEAMREGAILAIRDLGDVKDRYPVVDSITNSSSTLRVWTPGTVRWIVDGHSLPSPSPSLNVNLLPAATRFVRAEVEGADGTIVYSQPFLVRPRGDVNGDFRADAEDDRICDSLSSDRVATRTIIAACAARSRSGTF